MINVTGHRPFQWTPISLRMMTTLLNVACGDMRDPLASPSACSLVPCHVLSHTGLCRDTGLLRITRVPFPRKAGPLHMLFPLPRPSLPHCCLANSCSSSRSQLRYHSDPITVSLFHCPLHPQVSSQHLPQTACNHMFINKLTSLQSFSPL